MAKHWVVRYRYDGGYGAEIVQADTADGATALVMARAKPTWNPVAECKHVSTERVLYAPDLSLPHGGLERAVDLSWDRRDRGGEYLVIERGHAIDPQQRSYWLASGRIVASCATERGAKSVATRHARRTHGASAIYHVVPRAAVQIESSGAPYGCLASEG